MQRLRTAGASATMSTLTEVQGRIEIGNDPGIQEHDPCVFPCLLHRYVLGGEPPIFAGTGKPGP
ncbi:hypothetical protein BCAR13_1400003 [Paraburkholderia caribensis]|nr:hypothetical protein BCAR13_1400003 [Paraburkholderia caribensis]